VSSDYSIICEFLRERCEFPRERYEFRRDVILLGKGVPDCFANDPTTKCPCASDWPPQRVDVDVKQRHGGFIND
jgi:hypothetical protein